MTASTLARRLILLAAQAPVRALLSFPPKPYTQAFLKTLSTS